MSDRYGDKIVLDDFWAEYVAQCRHHEINYLIGAYRSSKSTFNVLAYALNLMETKDRLHLVIATSTALAKSIYEDADGLGLKYLFAERYRSGKYEGFEAGYIKTDNGERIVIYFGGATVSSYAAFRGLSVGSIALEEANLLHENTINEIQGRLFMAHSPKIFIAHNPCSEELPIRKFLAQMQETKPEIVNFRRVSIYHNPAMSDERRQDIISRYPPDSLFYRRYIMGEDCAAEGIIYTLGETNIIDQISPTKYLDYIIVIDPGKTKSTNAMLCIGRNVIDKTIDVLFECGIRNKDNMSKPYTSIDFARLETDFILDCAQKLNKFPKLVIIDSFAGDDAYEHLFKNIKQRRVPTTLKFPIKADGTNGKDKCEDRITRNLDLLFRGKLRFYKDCKKTISDMKNITYDPKKLEQGIETYIETYTSSGHFDYTDCVDYATTFYGPSINAKGW